MSQTRLRDSNIIIVLAYSCSTNMNMLSNCRHDLMWGKYGQHCSGRRGSRCAKRQSLPGWKLPEASKSSVGGVGGILLCHPQIKNPKKQAFCSARFFSDIFFFLVEEKVDMREEFVLNNSNSFLVRNCVLTFCKKMFPKSN